MDAALLISEDQDLEEVWPQIVAEYEQVTGNKLDPSANFDVLSQRIDQDIRKGQSRNGVRARRVIGDVGRCLKQFGDIVAHAASIAFGPSIQCWNAISFVISAIQSYQDVFDGFLALMEHSLAFLKRLNFFLAQKKTDEYLQPHLRGPAYAVLRHFLDLLKCSHKLSTRKREKFKLVLNIVLFNGDAEVSASLTQMEALVLSFTHAEIDQVLVDVKGLARYMHESAEETQRRHGELKEYFERTEGLIIDTAEGVTSIGRRLDTRFSKDQLRGCLKKIRDALLLEESPETWSKRQYTICGNRVDGTATWLLKQDPVFRGWSDTLDTHAQKVMVIRGESGFGKSYLFSHVVTSLEERYPRGRSQHRTYVLYYYFGEAEKEDSLRRCLSAMIYQLAALDETGKFATAIVEACEHSSKIATAEGLWVLFLETFQTAIQQGKCFLCIDGFACRADPIPAEIIATMARQAALPQSELKGCSFRILLTGTPSDLFDIPFHDDSKVNFSSLGPDTSKVLRSEMNAIDSSESFTNKRDLLIVAQARVQELRNQKPEIGKLLTDSDIQAIVDGVRGHYDNLDSKLKQISACNCSEDVREIVDKAEEGYSSTTQSSIKSLNKTLNPEAIAQLNELLRWLKGCRTWTRLDLLQSALVFTLGKTLFLKTMIKTRFSTLLTIDGQDVVTAPEGLRDMLSTVELADSEAIAFERTATVLNEAEIELCRRLIRNFCGSLDFERFRFDDFFNAHVGKQVSKIYLDSEEVLEVTILQTCVRSLTERQDDPRFDSLRRYASVWFYEHLVTVLNNMETFDYEKRVLRDIGASLARLLYENAAIDVWWNDDDLATLRSDWLLSDNRYPEALWKFVRHRSVAQGYAGDEEQELWMKDRAVSGSNGFSLLSKVASKLATRWFGRSLANEDNFWVAFVIVAKAKGTIHEMDKTPSIQEIDEFVKWAQANTELSVDETQWKFRQGATYLRCDYVTEGVAALKQAEEDGYSDWALPLKLAEVYCKRKEFQAALNYCHKFTALKDKLLNSHESHNSHDYETYSEAYYGRVLLREGECHKHLKCSGPAIICFTEVLEHDDSFGGAHEEALRGIFEVWRESKEYSSTINLLRAWRDTSKQGLFHWMKKIVGLDVIHLCILDAARATSSHEEVIDAYKVALHSLSHDIIAIDDEKKQSINRLRYFLAAMLFYGSTSKFYHQEALDIWEDLILNQNGASNSWAIAWDSGRQLFRSLREKATQSPTPNACEYTNRLVRLTSTDHEDIRLFRQMGRDPRLSLARLQYLRGNTEEARCILMDRLRSAFDGWVAEGDGDDKAAGRYSCLAHSLITIHDDVNAIAVWQATKPKVQILAGTPRSTDGAPDMQAVSGAEIVDGKPVTDEAKPAIEGEMAVEDLYVQPKTREPHLSGFWCDGGCGEDFDVSSNAYICRDCLDVQFCPNCHSNLENEQISISVCSSSHEFLYIPKVDQALWEKMEPDQMILDNALVSRDDWINGLRQQWDLKQDQIDTEKLEAGRKLKAARCIARAIFKWKRGQKTKPAAKAGSY